LSDAHTGDKNRNERAMGNGEVAVPHFGIVRLVQISLRTGRSTSAILPEMIGEAP
jgi:hypothetical protein